MAEVRRSPGWAWAVVAAVAACSSPQALMGSGGQCLQTTECDDGLVCVPQKNGPKICTTNIMSTVSTEEGGKPTYTDGAAPADAGAPGDGGTGASDAAPREGQAPTRDAGAAETSTSTPDADTAG